MNSKRRFRRRYAVRAFVDPSRNPKYVERGRYFTRNGAVRARSRMNTWPTFGSEWEVVEL